MKQGFPVELPPSATLLRIANIGIRAGASHLWHLRFLRPHQSIPHHLRLPCLHGQCSCSSVPGGAHDDVTRTDFYLPWICWQFPPPMTIQESCIMAVYSQCEVVDEPLPTTTSLGNTHDSAVHDFLDYEVAEGQVDDLDLNAYSPLTAMPPHLPPNALLVCR